MGGILSLYDVRSVLVLSGNLIRAISAFIESVLVVDTPFAILEDSKYKEQGNQIASDLFSASLRIRQRMGLASFQRSTLPAFGNTAELNGRG